MHLYPKRRKIIEFIIALLQDRSNLPQNQLAVCAGRPGQFVYQGIRERGSGLVRKARVASARTEDSDTGVPVVSEPTRESDFRRLAVAQGLCV